PLYTPHTALYHTISSYSFLFLSPYPAHRPLHSFPTRRSSDLAIQETQVLTSGISSEYGHFTGGVLNVITKSGGNDFTASVRDNLDRKSTRLNSSHSQISYAVFCLKKKKKTSTTSKPSTTR